MVFFFYLFQAPFAFMKLVRSKMVMSMNNVVCIYNKSDDVINNSCNNYVVISVHVMFVAVVSIVNMCICVAYIGELKCSQHSYKVCRLIC